MSDESSRRERARASLAVFMERERLRGSSMPQSLREAFSSELAQAFITPYQIPITVVANALLMSGAWFLLPRGWFFSVTAPIAFPLVLASWMYADVPATNVLAPDRLRVLQALDDPKMLDRLLAAKAGVLWLFVAPFCSLLAILFGLHEHDGFFIVATIVAICVVPVGCLPLAALLGIRWPYHPLQLQYRWDHRRPYFRMVIRWTALILLPYILVPLLAVLLMVPAVVIVIRAHEGTSQLVDFVNSLGKEFGIHIAPGTHALTTGMFTFCVLITCVMAVLAWVVGRWADLALIRRRRVQIEEWLSDPAMG